MGARPFYLSLAPFVPWRALSRPLEWSELFGRKAPLHAEIGFGNGEALVRRAAEHSDVDFVGLEPDWPPVSRALRRIAQRKLTNVRIVQIDARIAFERLFAPGSLEHVWCLFPCPWPKKRHRKFRLFSGSFLNLLGSRLRMGGTAQIVTDDRSYFEWILEELSGTDCGFEVTPRTVPPGFDTKYERRWTSEGQRAFHELHLEKARDHLVSVKEDVALKTHLVEAFDPERFAPQPAAGEITVEFKGSLYDPKAHTLVQRVIVAEDGITQDFWLEIVQQAEGWRIRPLRGTGMIPTAGVQRALDLARDAIQG